MTVTDRLDGFGPLAGVTIVELCEWVAAPAAARILAEMGAEVIKVEPPHGDAQRTQGPGFGIDRTATEDPTLDLNNTNKNWVALNLKRPEGMTVMKQLLARADVFMTSLRSQALERLGLDQEALAKEFPRLIWAQNRGYGEWGPNRDAPGFDAVAWAARGGVAASFPEAGREPAIPPQAFGDYNHAVVMAAGILAALFNRTRTGKGEKVVGNLYHTALWGGSIGILATQSGATYPKSRTQVPNPFNNTYQTADGKWLLLCQPQYDKYFGAMMRILGLDEYAGDESVNSLPALKASGKAPHVIGLLEGAFRTRPMEEWTTLLTEQDVPHQALFHYEDVIVDEEAHANDALRTVEYQAYGPRSIATSPIRFGSYGDPPLLLSKPTGYHTVDYLEKLGYTTEQIADLEASGAVLVWHGEAVPDTLFRSRRQVVPDAPPKRIPHRT
ncbi:CaiB/BaiF CoA transferase family protein [Raineyella fluvialis]|uniref:CoA transferase n=1 Tax=Raineyella fluvialis TaxID=2662261 RepID=A0A5Q2F630_9ACTN|nr:CoA transferase [Raineyella fluvialis]QGF22422.1 CoA transferase [Raineyella fluvialis]